MPRKKASPQFGAGRKPPNIDIILPGLGMGVGRSKDRFRVSSETRDPETYRARVAMVRDMAGRLMFPLLRARMLGKFTTVELHNAYRWQPAPGQPDRGLQWLLTRNEHSPLAELLHTYIGNSGNKHPERLRQQVARFLEHLGPDARPVDFTSAAVAQFLGGLLDDRNEKARERKKPASAATKNRYRAALSGFAAALVRDGHLDRHPIAFRQVKQFDEGAPRVDDLSPAEWQAYLAAMEHRPAEIQLLVKTLAHSGADVGELLLDLVVRHCLFGEALPRLRLKRQKVGKSPVRLVPIPRALADEIAVHMAVHGLGDSDRVFGMVAPTQLRKAHEAAREKIGRPDLRLKSLRHVAAIYWRRGGADIQTVQERLGHSTISQTVKYTAFGQDDSWDAPSTEAAAGLLNRTAQGA